MDDNISGKIKFIYLNISYLYIKIYKVTYLGKKIKHEIRFVFP